MHITSAPALVYVFASSIWASNTTSSIVSTVKLSVFNILTSFSIPIICPASVNGPTNPTITGTSGYSFFSSSIDSLITANLFLFV